MRQALFAITIYAFSCLSQAASAGGLHSNVLVVHPPIYPLVTEIMRGTGPAQLLIRPGQDNHHLQLTPKQAQLLAKADIIIVADRALSTSLAKPIQARIDKGATLIALTELPGADPLLYRAENHFTQGHESHHGLVDPHIWLDPVRMAALVRDIAAKMGSVNMAHDGTYRMNAEALSAHLREDVDNGIRMILRQKEPSSVKNVISYITYHDAYQYFEKRYGLSPTGYITQRPEEYIGAKAMKALMESAREQKVRCLITESQGPLSKRFALYTEARVVMLSPERLYSGKDAPSAAWIRNDYDRLLAKTARIFADCISGSGKND